MGTFLTVILVIFAIIGVLAVFSMIFIFSLGMAIYKDPEKFENEFNDKYNQMYKKTYGKEPEEKAFTFKKRGE
jgi:hypothetical protein